MNRIYIILQQWLPLALIIVALCGLVYLAVQQTLRQGANDPQIQMAEDTAAALTAGAPADTVLPTPRIDLARSLAPFMIVFTDAGAIQASSGLLHGQPPTLPTGVLDYVRAKGENRVTWQPAEGVRIAAVIVRTQGATPGFVLAGRSLREVEQREDQILQLAIIAMLVTLFASLVVSIFFRFIGSASHT